MIEDNVTDINAERMKRGREPLKVAGGGGGEPPDMADIVSRLFKLEGAYDALKVVRPMTIAIFSVVLAATALGFTVTIFQITLLSGQVSRLDSKIETTSQRLNDKIDANAARVNEKLDAIPQRLTEEFRAMRAENSAQTTALASAFTATRQAPPQVLLVPAPIVEPAAPKP